MMISIFKKRLKKLSIIPFIVFVALCNLININISYADSRCHYKTLDDFANLTPTKSSGFNRVHFKAQEKINDRQPDSSYENNKWHLVMRIGLYKAQVDKTLSEIERYLMSYSADEDIVEDKDDYYIARRDFIHYKHWNEAVHVQENGTYVIDGYTLHPDGTLTKDGITKKFTGLASLIYLNAFFANSDAGSWNYGIQETHDEIRVIMYDNEEAFNFDDKDPNSLENETDGIAMKNMPWYIQEHDAMIKKIAEMDITIIENIVRKNITRTKLDDLRDLLRHQQKADTLFHQDQDDYVAAYVAALEKALSISPEEEQKKYGVNHIITIIKEKHLELQSQLNHG